MVIARGRDSSDVPLTISFGKHTLEAFSVLTEEVPEEGAFERSLNSSGALNSERVQVAS